MTSNKLFLSVYNKSINCLNPKYDHQTPIRSMKNSKKNLINNYQSLRICKNQTSITELPMIEKPDFGFNCNNMIFGSQKKGRPKLNEHTHSELMFIKENFLKILKVNTSENKPIISGINVQNQMTGKKFHRRNLTKAKGNVNVMKSIDPLNDRDAGSRYSNNTPAE